MEDDAGGKVSRRLAERLAAVDRSGPIEVIVELRPVEATQSGSRQERITAVKAAFERESRPVQDLITQVGGRVLETAWLNQTVRGQIPADGLVRLAQDDAVVNIDLPSPITPD
jgi:hypothetical protein